MMLLREDPILQEATGLWLWICVFLVDVLAFRSTRSFGSSASGDL